jgi:hypothetical protein
MLMLLDSACQESNHHLQKYQNMTAPSPNENLCRLMSDFHIDTMQYDENSYRIETEDSDSAVRHNFDKIESERNQMILDKVKAGSWDNLDSMHTTTRTGKCMNNEYRRWYSLDSIHNIKAESARASVNCMEGRNFMSISAAEKDMQGSYSDYNDSMCSFASFGEASVSDNFDVNGIHSLSGIGRVDPNSGKASIIFASNAWTKAADNEKNPPHKFK